MGEESKRVIESGLEPERGLGRLAGEATKEKQETGGGKWRDIFDNITYSSGPGDNVYVWG